MKDIVMVTTLVLILIVGVLATEQALAAVVTGSKEPRVIEPREGRDIVGVIDMGQPNGPHNILKSEENKLTDLIKDPSCNIGKGGGFC